MPVRTKGLTVKIDGDTTGLTKALSSVNKEIKDTQSQLKDVDKLLKLDPKNTELLAQKQKLLAEAISSTKEKLNTLKTANEQATESVKKYDAWKEKYDPIQKEIEETEKKLKSLKSQAEEAEKQLAEGKISQDKYDALQKEIEETDKNLQDLKNQAEEVDKEFGKPISPEQYDSLQREIIETSQQLEKMEKEADEANSTLKKIADANSAIESTQKELAEVDRLLKLDPGNVELLAQKQRLLGEAVAETKTKLSLLKEQAEQANEALAKGEITQSQYDALQREIIETTKELEELEKQAKESGVAVQEIAAKGEHLKSLGDNISGIGEKLLPVTAAVTGLGTAAVKTTADFDSGMSKVAAISGATGDELDALRDKAKEMGAKTKFSASEAASAMEYMAMAGWKTEDMLNGIEGIMSLAAASGEDLATTSDIVTDALTAFGLSASDSGHFADVLAAASSNANTNVSMLGESFKYAAPVMGSLGMSAEDTSFALGLMANAGIKASMGGTSLRTAISNMVKPTDTMQEYMDKFGISITNADGSMKSLREIMDMLRTNMGEGSVVMREQTMDIAKYTDHVAVSADEIRGMSSAEQDRWAIIGIGSDVMEGMSETELQALSVRTLGKDVTSAAQMTEEEYIKCCEQLGLELTETGKAQQAAAATAIFGKNAMSGMLAIINAAPEDYEKLANAIDNCDGSSQAMADEMQNNLMGQITILKSQLEALAISFGEILMPTVREVVSHIQNFVEKLNSLDEGTKRTIATVALVAAAVGPVLIVVGKIMSAIGSIMAMAPAIQGGITTAQTAITGLAGTLGLPVTAIAGIVAAIGTLVAAFAHLWNTNEEFRNKITEIWNGIVETLQGFVQGIIERFEAIGINFDTVMEKLKAAWDGFCQILAPVFEGAFQMVATVLQTVSDVILGVLDVFIGLFTGNWEQAWTGVKEIFGGIWDGIKGVFETVLETIKGVADAFLGLFGTSWEEVWTGIKDFFTGVWEGIKDFFSGIVDTITDLATTGFTALSDGVKDIWTGIKDFAADVWGGIKDVISQAIDNAKEVITSSWENIKQFVSDIWESLRSLAENVFEAIKSIIQGNIDAAKEHITGAWDAIKDFMSTVLDAIKGIVSGVWEAIRDVISTVMGTIGDVISSGWDTINKLTGGALDSIGTAVANGWNIIKTAVSNAMQIIATGISQTWGNIRNGIGTAIGGIVTTLQQGFQNAIRYITSLPSQALGWGRDIIQGIINGITSAISGLVSTISNVASTISSYLHFSVPDEGPLTDYESWMPDFIGGLAKGIESSRGMIQAAMKDVSGDMMLSPTISGTSTMTAQQGGGSDSSIASLLGEYLPYLPQLASMNVVTDTGALVGQLAPQMNTELGAIAKRGRRQ